MTESNTTPTPATGNWKEQKSKLKELFPILTDSDLYYENGKKAEMLSKIQTKIGKTEQELNELISTL